MDVFSFFGNFLEVREARQNQLEPAPNNLKKNVQYKLHRGGFYWQGYYFVQTYTVNHVA